MFWIRKFDQKTAKSLLGVIIMVFASFLWGCGKNKGVSQNQQELNNSLMMAIKYEDLAEFKRLLTEGAEKEFFYGEFGLSPLHAAAGMGNMEMTRILLDLGCKVDIESQYDFQTPLYYAVAAGKTNTASLLLERGADINHRHAFTISAEGTELLKMYGDAPIHIVASFNQLETVRFLLDRGADVNLAGKGGDTALHIAARDGHYELALLLLQRGADPNIRNGEGKTPLDVAADEAETNIVSLLEEFGRR